MTDKTLFRFGRCEVDADARRVRLDGLPSAIEPRAFDLLVHLIRHRRRVVTKEELLETIWPRESVSSTALARAVMKARKAIGDVGSEPSLIRSLSRVGYRFAVPLDQETEEHQGPEPPRLAADALTIALLPFENATGDDSLGWLELGLMALVANALGSHSRLAPVAMQSLLIAVDGARAEPADRIEALVRQATGAKIVVRSRVARARTGFRLDFELCGAAPDAGDAVFAEKPAELGARMVAALSEKLFPDALMPDPKGLVLRDPLATESFARGMEALATHQWAKAINLFKLVVDLEPGNTAAQLELLRALSNVGHLDALRLSRRLLARAERENDLLLTARVQQAMGRLYLNRGEPVRADHRLEQSLRLADGQETPVWTARTLMLQASVAILQLDHGRAAEILQRMYRQCERCGDRILPVAGMNFEAISLSARGERERAVEVSAEAARQARELRAYSYTVDACDNAAWDLARLGRLAEAAAYGEEAKAVTAAFCPGHDVADAAPVLCWIYRLARMPEAAARLVGELQQPQQLPRPENVWRSRGLLAASEGRHAQAADCFRTAVDRHREAHDAYHEQQTLPWLIDALILAGRHDEAQAELALAAGPHFAKVEDMQVQVLHGHALLAHARGHAGEALALLAQLVAAQPAPLWLAWACIDAAWLLAEAGQVDAAAQHLEKLPATLAGHPIALAASARVRQAGGDTAGARVAQQACLKALGTHANDYLLQLGKEYEAAASAAALPPVPMLPSRL